MSHTKHINESLTETQSVHFIIESSRAFSGLAELDLSQHQKAIVFCDDSLKSIWWPQLEAVLRDKIKLSNIHFLTACESTKDLSSHMQLVNLLTDAKCSRDDLIIAVGGGCILDAVSYLASVYMRGIPLMMIPTTLIGQSDASTAGKTCINTDYSKNVLGTLYLPKIVYNNVVFLETNSKYHNRQGFSEIFKYGLLGSRTLLELLMNYTSSPSNELLMAILEETIRVRISIRRKDPLASNLGHTFGHALEKITNYNVNHGDAIAAGIVMALEFSCKHKIVPTELKDQIIKLMTQIGLNTQVSDNLDINKLVELMLTDKKSSNTQIRLILIEDIAKPLNRNHTPFFPVDPQEILVFLKEFVNNAIYVRPNHWEYLRSGS